MKLIINTAIFLLISFWAISFGATKHQAFEIYLVVKDNADLHKIELQENPLITDADILSYDWDKHELILSNDGIKKISKDKGLRGESFVIVVKGTRCFKGAFWSSLYSVSHPNPIINIDPIDKRPKNVIRIERAYPSEKFAIGPDPRNNEIIYKTLKELDKIVNAK